LELRNALRYEDDKANWEIENGIRRLRATTTIPGRKPQFKHDENTGAYVLKEGKGVINWYRYQEVILKPLLLPFAKECLKERPGTIVQEDGAPSHSSRYQQEVFDLWEIARLLWPPNSPDLNMIEPCWFWMKRHTTKKGPIISREQLKKEWIKYWEEMPQEKIQAWIERIIVYIKDVIRLEGGNKYKEGRLKGKAKNRVH
jgi:transposase